MMLISRKKERELMKGTIAEVKTTKNNEGGKRWKGEWEVEEGGGKKEDQGAKESEVDEG